MYNLPQITVLELYNQPDDMFLKYMKLQSLMLVNDDKFGKYKAKPLGQLEFGQVGELKTLLKDTTVEGVFTMFKIIYGCKRQAYYNSSVIDYFYALQYIKQEIAALLKLEKKMLHGEPNFEMELAGVKRLLPLGDLVTLIKLGRSFGLDPRTIERWPYNLVFSVLANDKITDEVRERYAEITKKK